MKLSMKKIVIPALSVLSGFTISYFAFRENPHLINRVSADEPRRASPRLAESGLLKKRQTEPAAPHRFLDHDEIFKEMERMQERMRDHFKNFDRHNLVIDDFSGDSVLGDVGRREDSDYVYLDVPIRDLDEATVDTSITSDHVTISGTVEKKYTGNSTQGMFRSTFSRTFPISAGVNQNHMAVVPEKDKVTLKFPKIKT